jgi:hypothetical protein
VASLGRPAHHQAFGIEMSRHLLDPIEIRSGLPLGRLFRHRTGAEMLVVAIACGPAARVQHLDMTRHVAERIELLAQRFGKAREVVDREG